MKELSKLPYVLRIDTGKDVQGSHHRRGVSVQTYDWERETLKIKIGVDGGCQEFYLHIRPEDLHKFFGYE